MSSSDVWLGAAPRRATLAVPALLTRMSRRPYSASIHSAARWTDLASVTSSWTKWASAPPSRRARSAARPRSSSRAPASTVTPCAPSWRAVSNPIPLLAPVIRAIFPVMSLTLRRPSSGRERPAEPGTGRTTLARAAGGKLEAVTVVNRAELAAFLRARRARVSPQDAGLPAMGRRRTPGLRRQEVAQLAGMSVDYYIRLEQARGPRPSRQVLAALARALICTADEREYLFRVAGESPPQAPSPSRDVSPGIRNLIDSLPDTPAYVVDAKYDVLAWNALATHFIGDLSAFAPSDRNMIRRIFRLPATAVPWTDPDAVRFTRSTVADLRASYARYPADPGIRSLVTELLGSSPRFAEIWAEQG